MNIRFKYPILFLLLVTVVVWLAVLAYPGQNLKVIACDVGQGDATLVIKGTVQILVDGGPGKRVIECLSKYMPFFDRKVEMVILTHPEKDHYSGLIDVLKTYKVENFVSTPLNSGNKEFELLKNMVGGSGIRIVNPRRGMVMRYGLIYLDILHPSEEFLAGNLEDYSSKRKNVLGVFTPKSTPNSFSIVAVLRLGEFDLLLTGDIGPEISEILLTDGLIRDVEYIKIPHHGSRNGLTKELLGAASPEMAVISSGWGNSYGHPHEEILEMLKERGVKILRTDELGDVVLESDGRRYWVKK